MVCKTLLTTVGHGVDVFRGGTCLLGEKGGD